MASERLRVMTQLITCAKIDIPMNMESKDCVILLNYIRSLESKIESLESELTEMGKFYDGFHGDI